MLIAASALQLIPDLRGQWMFDPITGATEFVEYGFFAQWFRGGVIATGMIGLASPLLGLVVLVATGANAVGRRRDHAQQRFYDIAAGEAAIEVPLVVRKRKRGASEAAIPIAVVEASAVRRLLARWVDLVLLVSCMSGGVLVGILATVGTIDWGAVAWTWPLVGAAAAGVAITAVQWAGIVDRGQTLGKILFDIRTVESDRDVAPRWVRGVVVRHAFPEGLAALLATGLAIGAGTGAVWGVEALGIAALFRLEVLRVVVAMGAWPVLYASIELVRSVPLLFGHSRAPHDRLSGTRVVRTSLEGAVDGPEVPLGFRLVARGLDSAVQLSLIALPLGAGVVAQQVGAPSGVALSGGLAIGLVLALAYDVVQWVSLSRTGTTLGMRAVGARVERVDGTPPSFVAFVVVREWIGVRFLGLLLPLAWPVVDAVTGLGDDRRCAHDRIANTRVVWADAAPPAGVDRG
ncbi:MAG: RDD family protein [Myxococcota bacterium]